jgi:hypothetical protein
MENEHPVLSGTSKSKPAMAADDVQARIAHLEAALAQADRFIVNALDSSVGFEDMCRKLRSAHAALSDALRKPPTRVA